jgi:hypothetical protein
MKRPAASGTGPAQERSRTELPAPVPPRRGNPRPVRGTGPGGAPTDRTSPRRWMAIAVAAAVGFSARSTAWRSPLSPKRRPSSVRRWVIPSVTRMSRSPGCSRRSVGTNARSASPVPSAGCRGASQLAEVAVDVDQVRGRHLAVGLLERLLERLAGRGSDDRASSARRRPRFNHARVPIPPPMNRRRPGSARGWPQHRRASSARAERRRRGGGSRHVTDGTPPSGPIAASLHHL